MSMESHGWMGGLVDGCKSRIKACFQKSKTIKNILLGCTVQPAQQSVQPVQPVQQPQPVHQPPQPPQAMDHSGTLSTPPAGTSVSVVEKVMSWNSNEVTIPGLSTVNQIPSTSRVTTVKNTTMLVDPSFRISNEKGMREEIEIELKTSNGSPFTGTITLLEAKHGIYRDCLGFKDFKN